MTKIALKLAAVSIALALGGVASAKEGPVPTGIPHLDHVYVILMENHGFSQIVGNQNAPWTNAWAKAANMAKNYFAVAHPSLTNYLEIVGGSNFGVLADLAPDWHNNTCTSNLISGTVSNESVSTPICPIFGTGKDAATPALDLTNESSGPPGTINIDGNMSIPVSADITGMTIADQLVGRGKRWKTYQESLPLRGPNKVNVSDGVFDNTTDFSKITPTLNPALSQGDVVALYAVKHNPFAYFANVQGGKDPKNSFANMAGFDGSNGLYADLHDVAGPAAFSFIVPNQCNDQHGRGNAGKFCNFDPTDNGSQAGLNPALIHLGDVALEKIVTSIKSAPSWNTGHNAIVVVWDENDYSTSPNTNQVLLVVDTNYGTHGTHSSRFYTHFSLLKTLEAGFGLPCLNHACDSDEHVMTDLFAASP